MHRRTFLISGASAAALLGAGAAMAQTDGGASGARGPAAQTSTGTATGAASAANGGGAGGVLTAAWTGPYGGVPPWDRVRPAEFIPAYDAAMAERRAEIAAIANQRSAPTFDNTIAAMERAGRAQGRLDSIFGVYQSNLNGPEIQHIDEVMSPRLAAIEDEITQNGPLFNRIKAVYDARERANLTPEQQRLTWLYYNNFVRSGANLNAEQKTRLSAINQRLATLFTSFSNKLLADEDTVTLVTDRARLAGLTDGVIASLAEKATEKGHPGQWAVANTRSAVEPVLTYANDRALREQVWRKFIMRGDNNDANDTKALITEILQLRAERARLLGYETHAHWRVSTNTMAGSPQRAMELMERVWPAAVERVHEEVRDMQAIANRENAGITIEPWDYRYYQEKVRRDRYALDANEVSQYLQLDKLREGMHWMANRLYGFSFTPVSNVPVFHPDVKVWEVTRGGQHVGLWYFDPYARTGKRSGAWMTAYRAQESFDGPVTTIVSNNANFVKPPPGQPVLVSWDDAETMFHEFGHALHGLNSQVTYPSLSGTAVPRDFVEFPSQVHEHWVGTTEVLSRFALHHQTGAPMPADLIEKIHRTETFNQGFATVEYLSSALVDMKLHLAGSQRIDPTEFERRTLAELNMPREIVMRHRTPQFGHVFSSDAYSAGYYSYLWSEVLDQDTWAAFVEAGNPFDEATARRFRTEILARGNSRDPAVSYRAFRGRDPDIAPLLRARGFPVNGAAPARA